MDVSSSGQLSTGVVQSEDDVLVFVDRNGVHEHNTRWCACRNSPDEHIQLLQVGLYPASITKPRTAFTFQLLEYFHIDAMECRTAASNFFSKLRRLTNDTFPDNVQVSNDTLLPIRLIITGSFTTGSLSGVNDCISAMARSPNQETIWLWSRHRENTWGW